MRTIMLTVLAAAVTVPAAFAGPTDPTKRHTAADMRLARAIALKRSDFVAGWTREKASGGDSGPSCSAQPDQSKLLETADVDPTFDSPNGGAVSVDSEVTLYRTKAMALSDWRSAPLPVLRACFAELLAKQLGGSTPAVKAGRFAVAAKAERVVGYRLEVTTKKTGTFTIEMIGLLKGRVEVFLSAFGPKGSFAPTMLSPFASLLSQRLAAHA
jgi:hypothetical protein